MSGSFTSLPNNSNFSFYDKYRKDDELFGQQIFNKAAFSIWSKLGESVLNKQRVILSSSHEGKIFYAIFSMSTTIGKPTHKYSLSDYAEFNDVEQLKGHIASNKITNLCCCYSEKMPDNLDGIDVKHYIKIANAYITKLSAVRPKLSLILGEGQHLQAKSAITVIVGSDQFDKPIFKELTTTWKELLGNAINGVDGVVVTLNVLFDGFGNILLQAKTSGNPKKILLSIPAETANIKTVSVAKPAAKNKKGEVQAPGDTLASFIDTDNNANNQPWLQKKNYTERKRNSGNSITKIITKSLGKTVNWDENLVGKTPFELESILEKITEALKFDYYYIDTNVFLDGHHTNIIEHFKPICEENSTEFLIHELVFDEIEHKKKYDDTLKKAANDAYIFIRHNTTTDGPIILHYPDENDPEYKEIVNRKDWSNKADDAIILAAHKDYCNCKNVLIISTDGGLKTRLVGITRKWEADVKSIGGIPNTKIRPKAISATDLIALFDYCKTVKDKLKI